MNHITVLSLTFLKIKTFLRRRSNEQENIKLPAFEYVLCLCKNRNGSGNATFNAKLIIIPVNFNETNGE